jgi:hypothetical protein
MASQFDQGSQQHQQEIQHKVGISCCPWLHLAFFFFDTFVPLGYVVSLCIHLSRLTLIIEYNVLLPILASCRWLTHKGHNFQGAHAASYT